MQCVIKPCRPGGAPDHTVRWKKKKLWNTNLYLLLNKYAE